MLKLNFKRASGGWWDIVLEQEKTVPKKKEDDDEDDRPAGKVVLVRKLLVGRMGTSMVEGKRRYDVALAGVDGHLVFEHGGFRETKLAIEKVVFEVVADWLTRVADVAKKAEPSQNWRQISRDGLDIKHPLSV